MIIQLLRNWRKILYFIFRTALENEQKDKESIAQRLEDSRHELAEKRREFEKLQSKHDELHMQNQDMFSMLKEKVHFQ